jgi:BMFP domain-containing protein YqiC
MSDRPRFFDDLAGVAGGAISALAGLRQEAEALVRTAVDDTLRRLDLVRREEIDALSDMATRARSAQEEAEARLGEMTARLAVLEARITALEASQTGREQRTCDTP